jgi:DNA repair protein RadC
MPNFWPYFKNRRCREKRCGSGREMINSFGSLSKLFNATIAEFSAIHGLGSAKYAQLQAVLELARRSIYEELQTTSLSSPQAVKHYLQLLIGNKAHESFAVLFLDTKNRLITSEELFQGHPQSRQRLPQRSS